MTVPRIVLIAGGSHGIGRAIAEQFDEAGDRVIAWGRNPEHLKSLNSDSRGRIITGVVDVSRPQELKQAVDRVVAAHGHIDVLINAAGYPKPITTDLAYEEAASRWDELVAVNLTSSFLLTQAAAPHITSPGGRIIFIGSAAAFTGSGRPGGLGYAAAKAGLSGLVFALAKEMGPKRITANVVVPGFIAETGITAPWPPADVDEFVKQTPLGRAGTPEDIAPAVAYLCSPAAAFVTGQFLHVNGGMLLGRQ